MPKKAARSNSNVFSMFEKKQIDEFKEVMPLYLQILNLYFSLLLDRIETFRLSAYWIKIATVKSTNES